MPTTSNMSLVMPTEGGDADIWDTILNALFVVVDAHDHTTGKGVQVPSAGVNINADLSWAGFFALDVGSLDFVPVAAASVASLQHALFVSVTDDELYFRTVSGVNIKITAGSTLNVSIVGGIGGDYSAIGALFDYDDATDTYRARQEEDGGVRQYAKLGIADLIIREYDPAGDATVPVETVTIKSPDALAASYALTLLTALPASTKPIYVTSAGALTTSIPTRQVTVHASSTGIRQNWAHGSGLLASTAGAQALAMMAVPMVVGARLTGYTLYLNKTSNAGIAITSQLQEISGSTGSVGNTTPGTGTETSSANNPGFITLSKSGLAYDVIAGSSYFLSIYNSASSTGEGIYHAVFTYEPVS